MQFVFSIIHTYDHDEHEHREIITTFFGIFLVDNDSTSAKVGKRCCNTENQACGRTLLDILDWRGASGCKYHTSREKNLTY